MSEWMKVMLEEISRKKSEAAEARAEEQTRRDEQGRADEYVRPDEHVRPDEQGRRDEPMTGRP
jgi:hypothetical protein